MDAMLGRRFGVTHFMDQNVNSYQNSSDTQGNICFSKEAAALVTRMVAPPIEGAGAISEMITEAGMGLRTTISYSGAGMAHDVTIDLLYGADMLRSSLAITVVTNLTS